MRLIILFQRLNIYIQDFKFRRLGYASYATRIDFTHLKGFTMLNGKKSIHYLSPCDSAIDQFCKLGLLSMQGR
jgi:hypothetical protein